MDIFCKEVGEYNFTVPMAESFPFPGYLNYVSLPESEERHLEVSY